VRVKIEFVSTEVFVMDELSIILSEDVDHILVLLKPFLSILLIQNHTAFT